MCNDRLELVKIVGKRSHMVPVLLPPDLQAALDCILSTRKKFIGEESEYLFATSKSGRSTTGWSALKTVVNKVTGLENPEAITSTRLRKYLATMSQVRVIALNFDFCLFSPE